MLLTRCGRLHSRYSYHSTRTVLRVIHTQSICTRQMNQEANTKCCHKAPKPSASTAFAPPDWTSKEFYQDRAVWNRASVNTFRCLVGCTAGDISMLFYLQAYYPHLSPGIIMGASMASGIMSSVVLETVVLRYWEGMALRPAFRTAVGMSMISMLVMEAMENVVDWHLTGGMIDFSSPAFWAAGAVAIGSGYLAALPYNYWRLKKYGKSCH